MGSRTMAKVAVFLAGLLFVTGCDDFDVSKEFGMEVADALAAGDEESLARMSEGNLAVEIAAGEREAQFELAGIHLDPTMEWDLMSWNSSTSKAGGESIAQAQGVLVQTEEQSSMLRSIFRYGFFDREEAAVEVRVMRAPGEEEFKLVDFAVLPPP